MRKKRSFIFTLVLLSMLALSSLGMTNFNIAQSMSQPSASLLASGLAGSSGSAIGPDGALYVPETHTGKIWRVNPQTGAQSLFASGLPKDIIGIGGVMDVAFIDETAYALVSLVGPFFGTSDINGIYRVDGPNSFTVVADIGAFSEQNPPIPDFFIPTGVQYAMQPFRGGFLVTDGHHNRVLQAKLNGDVSEVIAFDDIVPTGLAVWGNTVYMAETGPVPHLPENGKIVSFGVKSPTATLVAAGAPLLVDVEFGLGRTLYGLSQGHFTPGHPEGSPADPNTGALVQVNADGTFTEIIDGLNQPTSLEFIGNMAYVVTLGGEVWKIDNVSPPPYGK